MANKKQVDAYLKKWTYLLGLRWWKITVYWYRKPKEIKRFKHQGSKNALARCYADWRYCEAYIHINMRAVHSLSDREAEDMVLHELCHILINEMRECKLHHEERVVTGLTKAFMWARELKDD